MGACRLRTPNAGKSHRHLRLWIHRRRTGKFHGSKSWNRVGRSPGVASSTGRYRTRLRWWGQQCLLARGWSHSAWRRHAGLATLSLAWFCNTRLRVGTIQQRARSLGTLVCWGFCHKRRFRNGASRSRRVSQLRRLFCSLSRLNRWRQFSPWLRLSRSLHELTRLR